MGKKGGGRVRVKQVGPKAPPVNPLADLMNIPTDEMIHLPPKPDSNAGFFIYPIAETMTMNYSRFHAIYPTYIDSTKTVKLGRRIAASEAVPEPSVADISEALMSMNVRHVMQPYKGYPRDTESRWDNPGRVLVDLVGAAESGVVGMGADGSFDVDAMPNLSSDAGDAGGMNKKALLREVARRIPHLPNRIRRLEEKRLKIEAEKKAEAEAAKAATKAKPKSGGGSGGGGGTSSKKKKGKKKR